MKSRYGVTPWGEMEWSCTCPDYGDPCKHMAALLPPLNSLTVLGRESRKTL